MCGYRRVVERLYCFTRLKVQSALFSICGHPQWDCRHVDGPLAKIPEGSTAHCLHPLRAAFRHNMDGTTVAPNERRMSHGDTVDNRFWAPSTMACRTLLILSPTLPGSQSTGVTLSERLQLSATPGRVREGCKMHVCDFGRQDGDSCKEPLTRWGVKLSYSGFTGTSRAT